MGGILSLASNLVLPPWLNIKFILTWLCGLAFLALLWSWNDRGHQVQRLHDFESGVIAATSDATVAPDKNGKVKLLKPDQVVQAISGLHASYVSASTVLVTISKQTKIDKAQSDARDHQLTQQLKSLSDAYALADNKIQYLQNRPPVAQAKVCQTIEEDTNNAWDGWKK